MKEVVVMETILSEQDTQTNGHAEWRVMSDAIMRLSNIASLDDLLHQALKSWLQQLAPALRWQVAVDLYTSEKVSLGRAAEIAGLNYVVFMETLSSAGIALVGAESVTEAQKDARISLIHAGFNLPRP